MPPPERFVSPREPPKPNWFYRIRVTLLLIVLGGVLAYAYVDRSQREARRSWERTLRVAIILVEQAPLEPSAASSLALRIDPLEAQLEAEMRRYLPAGPKPFEIALLGPIASSGAPPAPPDGGELVEVAKYQWALRRWVNGIDEAGKLPTRGFDSRIYLVARPPNDARRKQVEGTSEAGGRVGVVSVELDASMADLALFVATHELFHTLGATERYAPDGSVLIPDGLGDPRLEPLYPQRRAEVMARHRALSPTQSKPPTRLDELAVGAVTAREIGWLR
jgi:hypothetical protein